MLIYSLFIYLLFFCQRSTTKRIFCMQRLTYFMKVWLPKLITSGVPWNQQYVFFSALKFFFILWWNITQVTSNLQPLKNTLKRTHYKVEAFQNVHRYSMLLIQESRELFQVRGLTSKILKSIYMTRSILDGHKEQEINVENHTTYIRNQVLASLRLHCSNNGLMKQFLYVGNSWAIKELRWHFLNKQTKQYMLCKGLYIIYHLY